MLDLDRFQHRGGGSRSRSRGREKAPHRAFGEWEVGEHDLRRRGRVEDDHLLSMYGPREGEGNGHIRQRANASMLSSDCNTKNPVHLNTPDSELMQGSSRKASGASIKMLIDEELSKDMTSRKRSPSVVAKLMGLDTLSSQLPGHMQKSKTCLHKGSSEVFLEKDLTYDEKHEFKDVFEVLDTKAAEKLVNWPVQKQMSKSRQRHKEMDYIRQKYMDAKRLSTDEKLQNSKQFFEALEVLESNKDLFLKLLEEPSSLLIRHLEEYRSDSVSPEASRVMSINSCNETEHKSSRTSWKSERKTERNTQYGRNVVYSYESDFVSHCIRKHSILLSKNLSKYKPEGRTETGSLPTRIVVLKPSLENNREKVCQENFELGDFGYRRCRESVRQRSLEMFSETRERLKSSGVGVTPRTKGSREITKEISEHMMHSVDDSVKSIGSRHCVHHRHEKSCGVSGTSTFMEFETKRRTSDWLQSSLSYSTGTSVSREARKRLSERWKMTHNFQEVGVAGRGSSTLGEMLAISDREMSDMPRSSFSCQKNSHGKMSGREVFARWGSPSGISSQDAWKDGCPSSLWTSKSLPESSFIYGDIYSTSDDGTSRIKNVMNNSLRKSFDGRLLNQRISPQNRHVEICPNSSQHSNFGVHQDENKQKVWEGSGDQDEFQTSLDIRNLSEKFLEPDAGINPDAIYLVDSVPVVCGECAELPFQTDERQLPDLPVSTVPTGDEHSIVSDQKKNATKETLSNEHETESHPCPTGQACSPSVIVTEHPSPVSVLELPDENESGPECFERVNADLQELRMQLQLLKSESRDTYEGLAITSDETGDGEFDDVLHPGGIQVTFKDEDNLEFCYVLDVLTESGFHNPDWNVPFYPCFSSEAPISPDLFEKLESMYSHFTWTKTERKLLFDLISSALAEILAPWMDPRPWIKSKRVGFIGRHRHLVDEVWQSLVRLKDAAGDPADWDLLALWWLDLADDSAGVGTEIERMLEEDLLGELVSEIILLEISFGRGLYSCSYCGNSNIQNICIYGMGYNIWPQSATL